MFKKKKTPVEFRITERQHELTSGSEVGEQNFWRKAEQVAEFYEQRIQELVASFHDLNEANNTGKRKFFLDLIEEIMDNIDRITADTNRKKTSEASGRWLKRFRRLQRKMEELLAKEDVIPIDLISAPPGLVTVADFEERDDFPDGTIISVNWRGYLWKGELFRKANVVVARNRDTDGSLRDKNIKNGERKDG
jgi:molecular chaperone GrpE (heat shock protein)